MEVAAARVLEKSVKPHPIPEGITAPGQAPLLAGLLTSPPGRERPGAPTLADLEALTTAGCWRLAQEQFGSRPWYPVPYGTDDDLAARGLALAGCGMDASPLDPLERLELLLLVSLAKPAKADQIPEPWNQSPEEDARERELLSRVLRKHPIPPLDLDVDPGKAGYDPDLHPRLAKEARERLALLCPTRGFGSPTWHQTNKRNGAHGHLDASNFPPHPDITRRLLPALDQLAEAAGLPTAKGLPFKLDVSLFEHYPYSRGRMWRLPRSQKRGGFRKTLIPNQPPTTPADPSILTPESAPEAAPPDAPLLAHLPRQKIKRATNGLPAVTLTDAEKVQVLDDLDCATIWHEQNVQDRSNRDTRFIRALVRAGFQDDLVLRVVHALPGGKASCERAGESSYESYISQYLVRLRRNGEVKSWPRVECCPVHGGSGCRVSPDGETCYCYDKKRRGEKPYVKLAKPLPPTIPLPPPIPPRLSSIPPMTAWAPHDIPRSAERRWQSCACCGKALFRKHCHNDEHAGKTPTVETRAIRCLEAICCPKCAADMQDLLHGVRAHNWNSEMGAFGDWCEISFQPTRDARALYLLALDILRPQGILFRLKKKAGRIKGQARLAAVYSGRLDLGIVAIVRPGDGARLTHAAEALGLACKVSRVPMVEAERRWEDAIRALPALAAQSEEHAWAMILGTAKHAKVRSWGKCASVESIRTKAQAKEWREKLGLDPLPEKEPPVCPLCNTRDHLRAVIILPSGRTIEADPDRSPSLKQDSELREAILADCCPAAARGP